MRHLYISGPMGGVEDFNFPAFYAVSDHFLELGWGVFNPAQHDEGEYGDIFKSKTGDINSIVAFGFNMRKAFHRDVKYICLEATHIYMLKGWENSNGAKAEHALAVALGHEVMYE